MDNSYTQYIIHTGEFLAERARGLEHYLRVITAHEKMQLDSDLQRFLTSADYKSQGSPYTNQLKSLLSSLPNLGQVGLDRDALDAYILMMQKSRP